MPGLGLGVGIVRGRARNRGGGGVTGDEFFAASGASFPLNGAAYGPNSVYFADTDTTWIVWEASSPPGDGAFRHVRVKTYNHATGRFSPEYVAGIYGLTNDAHGSPSLVRDNDGYVHIAYGAHNLPFRLASTLNPNDPSAWRDNGTLGTTVTYPKLVNVGGVLYCLHRESNDYNKLYGAYFKTTSVSGGVPTFGSQVALIDLDTDSRCYFGDVRVNGTDIHFVWTRANASDEYRRSIYYGVLDTTDDSVRNYDDTNTVANASLPVSYADCNTYHRLVEHTTGSANLPSLIFNASGYPEVFYSYDSTWSAPALETNSTVYCLAHNGTSWQSPVDTNGECNDRYTNIAPWVDASNNVNIALCQDPDNDWTRGGNIYVNSRVSGTWGTPTLVREPDGAYALNDPIPVRDGDPDIRYLFDEMYPSETVEVGTLKLYARGDGGIVYAPAIIHTPVNTSCSDFLDRLSTPPSVQLSAGYDALFTVIENIGIAKFDGLYFAGATEANSQENLIQDAYNLTVGGSPTFTPFKGWRGASTSDYLGTGFNPSTAGGAYALNSAHMMANCRRGSAGGTTSIVMSVTDGTNQAFILPSNASAPSYRLNQTGTSVGSNVSTHAGCHVVSRLASNDIDAIRNGVDTLSATTASSALPNGEIRAIQYGGGSFYSDNEVHAFSFGSGLTDAEMSLLWVAVRSFECLFGDPIYD